MQARYEQRGDYEIMLDTRRSKSNQQLSNLFKVAFFVPQKHLIFLSFSDGKFLYLSFFYKTVTKNHQERTDKNAESTFNCRKAFAYEGY